MSSGYRRFWEVVVKHYVQLPILLGHVHLDDTKIAQNPAGCLRHTRIWERITRWMKSSSSLRWALDRVNEDL